MLPSELCTRLLPAEGTTYLASHLPDLSAWDPVADATAAAQVNCEEEEAYDTRQCEHHCRLFRGHPLSTFERGDFAGSFAGDNGCCQQGSRSGEGISVAF